MSPMHVRLKADVNILTVILSVLPELLFSYRRGVKMFGDSVLQRCMIIHGHSARTRVTDLSIGF